ncbi:uncharacterized protein LOC135169139 [Diachasmimorpha longicaudata]|uniref:uncharacterized protein LOC135169139 n=1 Tax=Diachasmimorpha longicaudata TaxID=58733 RepID=UPI0030B8B444
MAEWWKAMNWFRQSARKATSNITEEDRLRHFKELLEAEEGKEEEPKEQTRRGAKGTGEKVFGEKGKEEETETEQIEEEREGEEEEELDKETSEVEVKREINRLKRGKAAGEDGIAAEFWKNLPKGGKKEIIEAIKELWRREEMIGRWRTATIFPTHKRGEVDKAANYRGVSLLDIGYKIMTRRLGRCLEGMGKLSEAQAGFRTNRSTMEHVFVLNTIIGNRLKRKKGKLYVAFVDFKAAFDKVDREKL